jgi:hypothetical protein
MRLALGLILFGFVSTVRGGGIHEPLAEPKALLRVVEALESSTNDSFTSEKSSDGGSETYHLKRVSLLGTVSRASETFYLAEATYIRSRPAGRDTPPARGHSFLVVLRLDFTIAAFSRDFEGGCRLDGNRLLREEDLLVDFGKNSVAARFSGYGLIQLPYFFADHITDEQWADDEFIRKEAAKE